MFLKHFHRPKDKKLIFNFIISINRDSTERHVRFKIFHQWFLVVELFSTMPASALDMHHVFIQYFQLLRPHHCGAMGRRSVGLRFKPGRVRFMYFRVVFFFHVVQTAGYVLSK